MSSALLSIPDLKPNPHWAKLPLFNRKSWSRVRFGDVVRMLKEQTDPVADGVERYVAGEHMETENVHIRQWGNVGDGYLGPAFIRRFRKGQVLYGSRRTYLKKVAVAEWDGVTANTTFVLEAVEGKLLQELLPWLMLSERFTKHSIQESKGSTNPYINFPDIAKFEFALPPLDQQRRIAEILWAVDEVRTAWAQTETAVLASREAEISDFRNRSKISIACSELLTLASGKAKPKDISEESNGGASIPVYGGNGIIGYTAAPLLTKPTVVVGRVGEYCGCVHFAVGRSWITDNAIFVKAHDERLSLPFLYWMLRAANLNKKKKIAGQPLISQSTIAEEVIPVPSANDQVRFLGRIDQLTATAATSAIHSKNSAALLTGILNSLS